MSASLPGSPRIPIAKADVLLHRSTLNREVSAQLHFLTMRESNEFLGLNWTTSYGEPIEDDRQVGINT